MKPCLSNSGVLVQDALASVQNDVANNIVPKNGMSQWIHDTEIVIAAYLQGGSESGELERIGKCDVPDEREWKKQRINMLVDAISKRRQNKEPVPIIWVHEVSDLALELGIHSVPPSDC